MVINPPWRVIAQHYSLQQWLFLLVFAVTSVLVPFSFYFAGLQHLDATRAIVTSCLEPVFSILIAAVALGELVRPLQALGIVLVLLATLLVQIPGADEGCRPPGTHRIIRCGIVRSIAIRAAAIPGACLWFPAASWRRERREGRNLHTDRKPSLSRAPGPPARSRRAQSSLKCALRCR